MASTGTSFTRRLARIWIAPVLLTVSLTILRAQAPQPWDRSAFSGDPRDVLLAAAPLVPNPAETVILLDERRIVLDGSSRATETHRLVYRLGKEDPGEWSNVTAVWRPWHQQRPAVRARVITPDGKQLQLDTRTLSEGPAGGDDSDTCSDTRALRAPLPGVAPGSIVETETVVRDSAPFFDRGVSTYLPVGHEYPTLQTRRKHREAAPK